MSMEVDRLRAKKKQIYEDLEAKLDEHPEWFDLTDEDILDALGVLEAEEAVFRVARAVESKLKERNA
jgi:hypothetical protein